MKGIFISGLYAHLILTSLLDGLVSFSKQFNFQFTLPCLLQAIHIYVTKYYRKMIFKSITKPRET